MLLILNKADLRRAVQIAKLSVPEKPLMEADSHLLFDAAGGETLVSATDGLHKFAIKIPCINTDHESGKFSCDPKRLEKALVKGTADSVSLDYSSADKVLKVSTGDTSFVSIQCLPTAKMISFPDVELGESLNDLSMDKAVLAEALGFCEVFSPKLSEPGRIYDFTVIHDGIAYSSNGVSKRGYFVCAALKGLKELNIRKLFVPNLARALKLLAGDKVRVVEDSKQIRFVSEDGVTTLTITKSKIQPSPIKADYIKTDGAYCSVRALDLVKCLDRSTISSYETVGQPVGINMRVSGAGEEASVEFSLAEKMKTFDTLACSRKKDGDAEVTSTVEYKTFKSIVSACSCGESILLFINDPKLKYYKVCGVGEVGGSKVLKVGVSAYSKVSGG